MYILGENTSKCCSRIIVGHVHANGMLVRKVIYVRCISCSYNNVAKSIRLLDKKAILVYTGKFSCK